MEQGVDWSHIVLMMAFVLIGLVLFFLIKLINATWKEDFMITTFIGLNWRTFLLGIIWSFVGCILYLGFFSNELVSYEYIGFLTGLSGGVLGKDLSKALISRFKNKNKLNN